MAKEAWDEYSSKLKAVYVPGDVYTEIGCEEFSDAFHQLDDLNTSDYQWKETLKDEDSVLPDGFTGIIIGITDSYEVILGACNQVAVDKP